MDASFRGDCARCDALCCVELGLDAGPAFAFDKPAGEPCRHLAGAACTIHSALDARGMSGCSRYDCFGAGQAVTAMFAGLQLTPATRRVRGRAFAKAREVQLLRRLAAQVAPQLEDELAAALADHAALLTLDLGGARARLTASALASPRRRAG